MKLTFILFLLAVGQATTSLAQQPVTATTDDGRKLLIYPDGTWRLVKQASPQTATARAYQRSANAKLFVKAPAGQFGLWVDEQKWRRSSSTEETGKITLVHTKGDGYALVMSERISVPTDQVKTIALANARKASPDVVVLAEEKRTVNGKDILCMKMSGTIEGIPFIYLGYYYGGTEGTLQMFTYTSPNLFDEFKADFEELLRQREIIT